jgi:Protein of unknown function (DUF3015)
MRKLMAATIATALAGAFTLTTVSTAQAEGYGTAGCGLGSIVFGNKPGIIQVLAATTNGTFGTQTFGITTGTSNCKDSAPSVVSAKAFIQANREALAKDVARGQGETISSLATLAGCANDKAVGARLQQDFKQIFPTENVSDIAVSDSIVSTLQAHPELSCSELG